MFNVAFVGTAEASLGHEGIVTWSQFKDKESFDRWYTPERRAKERVLEEGVSVERCVELVRQTPVACRIASAVCGSISPSGEIDTQVFVMKFSDALQAAAMSHAPAVPK